MSAKCGPGRRRWPRARRLRVAAAQRDHAQDAVRGRGVPEAPSVSAVARARPAASPASASRPLARWIRPARWTRCLGRDSVQRLGVRGLEDVLRLVELAQVDQGRGEREQRLDLAGIGGDPVAAAGRVAQQREPVADLALVPADDRAGDQGRDDDMAAVPGRDGEHGARRRPGELVAQPGQGPQQRGHRVVAEAAGQVSWARAILASAAASRACPRSTAPTTGRTAAAPPPRAAAVWPGCRWAIRPPGRSRPAAASASAAVTARGSKAGSPGSVSSRARSAMSAAVCGAECTVCSAAASRLASDAGSSGSAACSR